MASTDKGWFERWLGKTLEEYLEDFQGLDIAIPWKFWNTNIGAELNNAWVKDTIIEKFLPNSPFKLRVGKLGSFKIDGFTITCTDVNLVVVPNKGIVFDKEKEKRNSQDQKMKALEQLETVRNAERGKKSEPDSTWMGWIGGKIVNTAANNIKVILNNVHIRYEDEYSDSESPFSAGITIKQIRIIKVQDEKSMDGMTKKSVELDDLNVYWNSKSELVSRLEDKNEMVKRMEELAASDAKVFVIKSWSPACELSIMSSPEKHKWTIPQTDAKVNLNDISIKLDKSQYDNMLMLTSSLDRFSKAEKYRKHRGILSLKGEKKARLLWKFAYNSILNEVVRRRRNEWSWKRIKNHLNLRKAYTEAYRDKRTTATIADKTKKIIEDAEDKMDLWNLNLARTMAELEIDKRKLQRVEDQSKAANLAAKVSSIFSSGSNTDVTQPLEGEEKAKLADSCERIVNISHFPKDYISQQVSLGVNSVHLTLNDSIDARLSTMIATSKIRAGAAASDATIIVSDIGIRAFGCEFLQKESGKHWFFAQYTTNPLDGTFDQKAKLMIEPVIIKFNSETVYELMRFFTPPESIMFDQLLTLQLANYDSIISNTLTGLKHAAAEKQRIALDIVVHPAIVHICEGGRFDEKKISLTANCGEFKVATDTKLDPTLNEEQRTRLLAYHRFAVSLTGLNCGIAENFSSKSHSLFHPITSQLQFHACAVEDKNLPSFRLLGSLPDFVLSIDEKRLLNLIRIVLSLPPSKVDSTKTKVEQAVRKISSTNLVGNMNQPVTNRAVAFSHERPMLETDLHMEKIGFELVSGDKVLASFILSKMSAKVTKQIFETIMVFEIGDMKIGSNEFNVLEKGKPSDTLLTLAIIQASPDSPNFASQFGQTLTNIDMKVARVVCNLIQEPLVAVSAVLRKLSNRVNSLIDKLSGADEMSQAQSMVVGVAASVAEKATSVLNEAAADIPSSVIKSQVNARFIGMEIHVGAKSKQETAVAIDDFLMSATMKSDVNEYRAKLKGVSVKDVTEGATHKKILIADIQNHNLTFEFGIEQVVNTNKQTVDPDWNVKVRLSTLNFIYMALWVSRMTLWIAPFSKRLSDSAEKLLTEVAKPAVDRPMKIGLDISLESPVIFVPCTSNSIKGLTINMGSLRVTNKIIEEKNIVVDEIDVTLSRINASVGALSNCESLFLKDTQITTKVSRNLSWEINKSRPLMKANVKVGKAELSLSKAQYVMLMSISTGNMQEKVDDENDTEIAAICEEAAREEIKAPKPNKDSLSVALCVFLVADHLQVFLLEENLAPFAYFECCGLKAEHTAMVNGITRDQVTLKSITAEDKRTDAGLNNIIECREGSGALIDLKYIQCEGNGLETKLFTQPLTVYFHPNFLGNLQKFFTQFDENKARLIEDHYQLYKSGDLRYQCPVIDKIQYDFPSMTLTKGTEKSKREIIRVGEKAIQAVVSICKERTSYSLKLARVQIDNHLDHSPFPCILSIAAPPLTDIVEFTRKPLFEMNIVQRNQIHSLVPEIERFSTSTHPIALKIDLGVLGELQRFVSSDEDDNEKEYGEDSFKSDYTLTELTLEEIAQSWRTMQPKSMYQQLELGMMTIHLAITSGEGLAVFDLGAATNFVSLLTKFAGVDTVLSLNSIERKNFSCSTAQLQAELSNEWLSLDRKIVLGLKSALSIDAIGNPVQMAREFGKGFEGAAIAWKEGTKKRDASRIAFYALKGARLFAGHAVGGTAGALGKVVETLGKGASTLTFDSEYQRRRQDEIMRRPKGFYKEVPHSFSVFGRSLMGGVTGVIEKPIDAAKKGGAAGLPLGIGKGLLGVVVRPVSSTLDLTSSMIQQLRHAASTEWIPEPMRPSRHIEDDCILRPFNLNESIGFAIFKETDNGFWAETNEFIAHGSVKEDRVLLITDKRLILSSLGATWESEWAIDYSEIKELRALQGGVKVVTATSKGFLKRSNGKIVLYNDAEKVNGKLVDAYTKWKNQAQ